MNINSILNLVRSINDSISNIKNGNLEDLTKDTLNVLAMPNTMAGLMKPTIITPTIVVSEKLRGTKYIDDVIRHNIKLFASFYLQSFEILVALKGVKPSIAIEMLSSSSTSAYKKVSFENFKPVVNLEDMQNDFDFLPIGDIEAGLEDYRSVTSEKNYKISKRDDNEATFGTYVFEIKLDFSKNVTFHKTGNTKDVTGLLDINKAMTIPITVQANIKYASLGEIINVLEVEGEHKKFVNRADDLMSGKISWSNFIFCGDLIREYKQQKLKDENDLIKLMQNRKYASLATLPEHKMFNFSAKYATLIISESEVSVINKYLPRDLKTKKGKEALMDKMSAMLVTTVDTEEGMVEVKIDEIEADTVVSIENMAKNSKKTNDVKDIMTMLMAGSALKF